MHIFFNGATLAGYPAAYLRTCTRSYRDLAVCLFPVKIGKKTEAGVMLFCSISSPQLPVFGPSVEPVWTNLWSVSPLRACLFAVGASSRPSVNKDRACCWIRKEKYGTRGSDVWFSVARGSFFPALNSTESNVFLPSPENKLYYWSSTCSRHHIAVKSVVDTMLNHKTHDIKGVPSPSQPETNYLYLTQHTSIY